MMLTKDTITLFPTFSLKAVELFERFSAMLDTLKNNPSEILVNDMMKELKSFLQDMPKEMDADFYSAFSYRADGSLVGDLWRNLKESAEDIVSTLAECAQGREAWIAESIKFEEELRTKRRYAIRVEQEAKRNQTEIPAEEEGC